MNDPDYRTRCQACGLPVVLEPVVPGQEAACPHCWSVMTRCHRDAWMRMRVFSITAAGALLFANLFPFLTLSTKGQVSSLTLMQSMVVLFDRGHWALGAITSAAVIALPMIFLLSLQRILYADRYTKQPVSLAIALKLVSWFQFWNMAEIYFLGVLVSIIKVISLADVRFGPSFWFFAVFIVAQLATLVHFDMFQVKKALNLVGEQRPSPRHIDALHSWHRSAALLATGLILYIPANALPIMTVTTLGKPEPNTIIGGVITLWHHGSYPIALVIFTASVMVPIGKFLVLIWLLASQRMRQSASPEARMVAYHITEFIGRWSMIDVFVVAFLAALVQFGNLMAIEAGPAALAFAGMVVATMLAADSIDTTAFWKNHE